MTVEALLSYQYTPFLCGFTVTPPEGASVSCALSRNSTGDTLTVYSTHSTTVFRYTDGTWYLCTAPDEREPELALPISLPEAENGIGGPALWRSCFSLLPPTEETRLEKRENGYCLTTDTHTVQTDKNGYPRTIALSDGTRLEIGSFSPVSDAAGVS